MEVTEEMIEAVEVAIFGNCKELEPSHWRSFKRMKARAALTAMRALEPRAASDGVVEVADFLVNQTDEPWPNGTDADRVHYWRDRAIDAARRLAALQSQPSSNEARLREALEMARPYVLEHSDDDGEIEQIDAALSNEGNG